MYTVTFSVSVLLLHTAETVSFTSVRFPWRSTLAKSRPVMSADATPDQQDSRESYHQPERKQSIYHTHYQFFLLYFVFLSNRHGALAQEQQTCQGVTVAR